MASETKHSPRGWSEVHRSGQTAEFSHDRRGVIVEIEPRMNGKSKRRRSGTGTSYRIRLKQDWFSTGTLGDKAVSATVDTFSKALQAAYRFMEEFNEDTRELEADHGAELTDSLGSDAAEDILTTEASSMAFVESVGYSDSLLLDVLDEAVGDAVQLVAHRDDATPVEVYRKDGISLPEEWPHDVFGYFGIDKAAVDSVFGDDAPVSYVIDAGELRLYRFVAGIEGETVVILEGDAPVSSPSFERAIAHIIRERWK